MRGKLARAFPKQISQNPLGHILDIHRPLAQIRIIDLRKRFAVLFNNLMKRRLDVDVVFFKMPEHLVDERAVLDHQQMGVKNRGVFRADGDRHPLLDFQQIRAGGHQSRLEPGDLGGNFRGLNGAQRDFLLLKPVNQRPGMGNARRRRSSPQADFFAGVTG